MIKRRPKGYISHLIYWAGSLTAVAGLAMLIWDGVAAGGALAKSLGLNNTSIILIILTITTIVFAAYRESKSNRSMIATSSAIAAISKTFLDTYSKVQLLKDECLSDVERSKDLTSLNIVEKFYDKTSSNKICDCCCDVATDLRNTAMAYLESLGAKEECRVLIKILKPTSNNPDDISDWKYIDAFWDRITYPKVWDDIQRDGVTEHEISKYSPVRDISSQQITHFACSDLKTLSNSAPDAYITPSEHWDKRYNAKMIVPIEYCYARENIRNIYGFISIDCMNLHKTDAFSDGESGKHLLNLAKHSSALLYVVLEQIEKSRGTLSHYSKEKAGYIGKNRRSDDG